MLSPCCQILFATLLFRLVAGKFTVRLSYCFVLFLLELAITIRAMLTHEHSLETSLLLLCPGIVYTALERPSLRDLVEFEGHHHNLLLPIEKRVLVTQVILSPW